MGRGKEGGREEEREGGRLKSSQTALEGGAQAEQRSAAGLEVSSEVISPAATCTPIPHGPCSLAIAPYRTNKGISMLSLVQIKLAFPVL